MNKRIKKKVTKRVLIKIKNKQPLSQFETKFFMKNILPTIIETFNALKKALEKALPTVIKIATERVKELSDAMEEVEQANNESTQKLEFVNKELYFYTDNELAKAKVASSFEGMQERQLRFSDEGIQLVPEKTKESESSFKQVAEIDYVAYEDERSKWLAGIDVGKELSIVNQAYLNKSSKQLQHSFSDVTDERINAGLINAESIDVSNFNFSAPESHHEIQSRVKETKWQKAKGKLKGWFGK